MATNETAMNSVISLDSVQYYTSLKDFLDEHCDGSSPYLDQYLDMTLPVFAAAIVTSPGTTVAEGWGFFTSPRGPMSFSVPNVSPYGSRIFMEWKSSWDRSPEHFLHDFHSRIVEIRGGAVRKFFRENAATCIETMWSKVLGVDDQVQGLQTASQTLRTVAVPDATSPDAHVKWKLTSDDFEAVDILTGKPGVLVDVIHSRQARTFKAPGCSITISPEDQSSIEKKLGSAGTAFIMNPIRFPGLLLSITCPNSHGSFAKLHVFEDDDRNFDDFVSSQSVSQEGDLDSLFDWRAQELSVPRVPDRISGFLAAFNASLKELTPAIDGVSADASLRSTIWRAVTGENVGRSHLVRKYREAVERSADEEKWTPGTKFTGKNFFNRESPSSAESSGEA